MFKAFVDFHRIWYLAYLCITGITYPNLNDVVCAKMVCIYLRKHNILYKCTLFIYKRGKCWLWTILKSFIVDIISYGWYDIGPIDVVLVLVLIILNTVHKKSINITNNYSLNHKSNTNCFCWLIITFATRITINLTIFLLSSLQSFMLASKNKIKERN